MRTVKIRILLVVILLGNAVSMQGMSNAVGSSAWKAGQSYMRKNFTSTHWTRSFWPKLSLYMSKVWKFLINPKAQQMRAANAQKKVGESAQQEISKQKLDQEEEKIDQS